MSNAVMSIKEAAEYLGICEATVRELVRTADFPAMKLGKNWRISRKGLEEWIEEKTRNHEEVTIR